MYKSMHEALLDGWAFPLYDIRRDVQIYRTKDGDFDYPRHEHDRLKIGVDWIPAIRAELLSHG